MKRNPTISTWLWECRDTPARPEEVSKARETLLRGCCMTREDAVNLILDAPSLDRAVARFKARANMTGGGISSGGTGYPAYRYGFYSDGLDYWFGDDPERWQWTWSYRGWSSEPGGRLRVPSLMFRMQDVPRDQIRYVHVTVADLVRHVRARHIQPSLFEAV